MKRSGLRAIILVGVAARIGALAGEVGHYTPGLISIRDLVVPEAGFYGAIYNYSYSTNRINGTNGDQISSVTIKGPGATSATLNVNVDVNMYALAPMFIWVTKTKVLGAKYGAFIAPSFTNASINGLLSSATGAGRSASAGQFNIGDTLVQPIWLGWGGKHLDVSYGYAFYIPTGKYSINTLTLPVVGDVRFEAPDNTGFGFWTNQHQAAIYWYPWPDKRLAVQNALTWEFHRKKRGFNLHPGENLTWNWGLSEFLPLKKDQSLLLEAGLVGHSSMQVTSDYSDPVATQPLPTFTVPISGVKDNAHAIGAQVGMTSPKRPIALNFRWLHEYSATDRFQGSSLGLNFVLKF